MEITVFIITLICINILALLIRKLLKLSFYKNIDYWVSMILSSALLGVIVLIAYFVKIGGQLC